MCGQHNIRATARNNTGQNIVKGYTPSPRRAIKLSDPVGNRTSYSGFLRSEKNPEYDFIRKGSKAMGPMS